MLPFRSRSIHPDATTKMVFTWLVMKAQFLIKFWLFNHALIPSSGYTLLFKELAFKIFCPQDRLKCTQESVNRSWLLWCECRLSRALKQVMGDTDWRNGWLLWSHLEWRELIIHMPIKHSRTRVCAWPFYPRPIKVFVRIAPARLLDSSSVMSSTKYAPIIA